MSEEETKQPDQTGAPRTAKYWHEKIKEYQSAIGDKWQTQCDNLDKLYARERADSADREYAIFWANIEVLRPAVYARAPVPVVSPRFKGENILASTSSEVLERCLVTTFEQSDIDGCMREVRDEFLRYGRGTARARLDQKADGSPCVAFDHFTSDDFAHDAARTWREVKWVGFRAWLNKEDLTARFEEALAKRSLSVDSIPMKKRDKNSAVTQPEDQAPVWEIWDRTTGCVYFVAEDFEDLLEHDKPWLDLTSFWPCPKPVFGTLVPKKLKPVPDILQYKDQIEEINEYTARIAALSETLRLKGFYPAGSGELSDAIEAAMKSIENRALLIPVSSFAALGGTSLKDNIVWVPVEQALNLVQGLVELRRVVIEDVYQITGISDIVRGQTDSSETATAQQIKANWGSMRIRERQNELARFARDMTRIAGEIIAENFPQQTVAEMSQMQLPSQQDKAAAQMQAKQMQAQAQMMGHNGGPAMEMPEELEHVLETPSFEEVMAFLGNDKARGFVIEIETDSTIQPDEDAEKQRRIEFVESVGSLFQKAAPIVLQAPMLAPFMGQVLKFTAQGFRAGRPLEGAIDGLEQQLKAMAKKAMNPPPPQPDPTQQVKLETAKVQGQTAQIKGQAEVMKANASMAQTQMDMQQSVIEHKQDMERMAAEAAMPQPDTPVQ